MKDERLAIALVPAHGMFTPGKRSPQIPPGEKEWILSRKICESIEYANKEFWEDEFNIINTNPGPIAIRESQTIEFLNKLYRKNKKMISLPIHTNAARGTGWSKARGYTLWISKKASEKTRFLAEHLDGLIGNSDCLIPPRKYPIRENRFWITTKTACPTVLIESGFHTNLDDVRLLQDFYRRREFAEAILKACHFYNAEFYA
jgi:hypothetical protein